MKRSLRRLFQAEAPELAPSPLDQRRARAAVGRCLLLGLLIVPTVASPAENPYVGHWRFADPKTCATDYTSDDKAVIIEKNRIDYFASSCAVKSSRALQFGAVRLKLACESEGEKTLEDVILAFVEKSDVNEDMLVIIEVNTGDTRIYRKCP